MHVFFLRSDFYHSQIITISFLSNRFNHTLSNCIYIGCDFSPSDFGCRLLTTSGAHRPIRIKRETAAALLARLIREEIDDAEGVSSRQVE